MTNCVMLHKKITGLEHVNSRFHSLLKHGILSAVLVHISEAKIALSFTESLHVISHSGCHASQTASLWWQSENRKSHLSPGLTWVFYPNEIKVSSSEKQGLSVRTVESENQFSQLLEKILKADTRDFFFIC